MFYPKNLRTNIWKSEGYPYENMAFVFQTPNVLSTVIVFFPTHLTSPWMNVVSTVQMHLEFEIKTPHFQMKNVRDSKHKTNVFGNFFH